MTPFSAEALAKKEQSKNSEVIDFLTTLPFSSPMSDWSQLHQLTTKDVNFLGYPFVSKQTW